MRYSLHHRQLLSCLVAVLLVTTTLPAAAAVGPTGASSPVADAASSGADAAPPVAVSVTAPPSAPTATGPLSAPTATEPPSFGGGIEHVPRGGIASVPVTMADGANATVSVSGDAGHSATVVVADSDGDGTATLRIDTYDGAYRASDGDDVTVTSKSGTTPLAVGDYELRACVGAQSACDDESAVAATRVVVGERSTDGIQTWVAPGSATLSNLSAIDAARSAGTLTRNNVVAENDTLVLELRASGLEGAIAARDGANVTARFFAFLNRSGVSLVVPDRPGAEQEYAYLDVTNASAVSVVPDSQNYSYYLVADLSAASVTDDDGGVPANNRGVVGEYEANFTLAANSTLTADGRETATAGFEITDEEVALDTPSDLDRVLVAPRPNQTISGKTNLAPGHRVMVEIGGPGSEVRSKTVRVRNGTETASRFAATFDFGDVATGANISIAVRDGNRSLLNSYPDRHEVNGSVVPLDATVNLTDRGLTAQGVLVENSVLSHGGYLAVHRGSADGEVITRSQYLAPGKEFGQFVDFGPALESNATLVVVAHRRGPDGALGEPYTENGSVVADSVAFTVERETTATTTNSTTGIDSTTTTDVTTATTVETRTPYPQEGVPGFGVSAALVGLLAGLGLARRKK